MTSSKIEAGFFQAVSSFSPVGAAWPLLTFSWACDIGLLTVSVRRSLDSTIKMELPFDLMMVKDAVLWLAPTFVLPVYCYFISQTRRNLVQHLLWIAGIIACGFIPMTVPAGNTAVRFEIRFICPFRF